VSTLDNGIKLGKYLIVRHLGSGGMADVYEAEDSHLGRRVALKVLPPELARNPQFIQRFESEVRKAASLNHGGIVPVFDFGFDNGTHYYSMRLLTHGSLRNRIDEGLSDAESLSILRDIADALGHAHSRQPPLVHRDVKPENILFDEQGHALLTDFGIAKAMDGNQNLTATGVAIGSALYMSPEQARGKKDVDGRADLYSLGALFYEMLMGAPPYEGEDQISIILKHVTEPIPQLPDKFAQYQSLLDTMMAKNPAQRVASARDLVGLIEALMPQRPTRSTPGARTTGQTQTAAFLVGSDAALLADQQRQRDELLAQSQRDAEAARQRAQAAARQAEEDALAKLLETQRLEREKAAAQQAAEQQRQREEREQAERRAAEQARAEAEAKQKAEAAAREQQRVEAERLAREKAAAEAAAAEAKAQAARKAEEARAEAEAKQKAEDEARRQKAEAERLAREQAEAQKAAEQQRLRDEQARVARKLAEDRVRAETQARRQAEEEARRQQAEAEALFEREMAAAMEAEQQRSSAELEAAARKAADKKRKAEEEARRQQLEAERIEREKAAAAKAAAEQTRLQGERTAAARKAEEETRRQQKLNAERLEREQAAAEQKRLREEAEAAKRREKEEAAARKQAEEQARKDAAAKAKADEQARAEQARLERQRAANQEAEAARRAVPQSHNDDVTVIRRLPDRAAPRPSEVETLELPPAGPDLRAPKRAAPEAQPRSAASSPATGAVQAKARSGNFLNDLPRKPLLIAGGLVLVVAAGLIWSGSGGQGIQAQVEAAFANPAEALSADTLDLFPKLDEADRNALLVPGGAVERYFLARSEAAFTVEPLSDDRVAALTMLRKANQELFPRPSKALTERIDALSEPLYQLLDSVDGKTPFSLSPDEPSVLQVLRQLVLAGDEKRLEKRFRSELLRKFEAALSAARKKELAGYERLLGDLEIVYGADQPRRDALQARLDEAGDPEPAVVTPTAAADDEKVLAAAEQLVAAAIAGNRLDDARSEVLKLRKADKLDGDRGKALADKVARKYAEQAKAEIESASVMKETSAAFELKAALLASVRQLSRRVDITALQALQRAKAELIVGRELADRILGGATLAGEQGVQAGINLDAALGQLNAAPKAERDALKGQLSKALEKLRGQGISQGVPPPPPPPPPPPSNDPCAAQKACTDSVGGQTLRSYRLGAAAPYDRLFLQEQEVSGELYSIVMGTGMTAAPRLPVTGISADDAKRFAEKLSTQTRHKFRLPTAAEWQLAAKEIRPNVLATANCANGGGRLNNVEKPIGQAKGAVNIIGNAAEIVADGGGYRVAGASFRDAGADCSPESLKAYAGPDAAIGFRLVRVVE